MSYILEALKRAERERKLGAAPPVLDQITVPPPLGEEGGSRRWLLLLCGALLLVAVAVAVTVAVLRRDRNALAVAASAPATAAAPVAAAPAAAPPAQVLPAPAPAVVPAVSPAAATTDARIESGDSIASLDDLTADAAPAATIAPTPAPSAAPANPSRRTSSSSSQLLQDDDVLQADSQSTAPRTRAATRNVTAETRAAGTPVVSGTPASSAPAPAPAPGDDGNVVPSPGQSNLNGDPVSADAAVDAAAPVATAPAAPQVVTQRLDKVPAATATQERKARLDSLRRFREMPPAYRTEFPTLTVDVHVYNADGAHSFVVINGKRYHDGDTIAEGPHIAEIVSDGIVFEWRGEKVLYTLGS